MLLTGSCEDKRVAILYEGEGKPCYLQISYPKLGFMVIDDVFPNPTMLSAALRCEVGAGPSRILLEAHGIPHTSQLWHLNHDGPPKELA